MGGLIKWLPPVPTFFVTRVEAEISNSVREVSLDRRDRWDCNSRTSQISSANIGGCSSSEDICAAAFQDRRRHVASSPKRFPEIPWRRRARRVRTCQGARLAARLRDGGLSSARPAGAPGGEAEHHSRGEENALAACLREMSESGVSSTRGFS